MKIRNAIALILAALLLLSGCAATSVEETKAASDFSPSASSSSSGEPDETVTVYASGVYEGTAIVDEPDFSYTVTAAVTVEDGLITDIQVTCDDPENELYMSSALSGMKEAMLSAQGTEVDIKSGATASSDALIAAVNDALAKAGTVETTAPESAPPAQSAQEPSAESEAASVQTEAADGQTAPAEPEGSVKILGTIYYYGRSDSFLIGGAIAKGSEIADTGVYYFCASPLSGILYGTCDMLYADFYYGELTTVQPVSELTLTTDDAASDYRVSGMYDAVTSATKSKWQQGDAYYTQALDEGGGEILGLLGISVAVDAELYVQAAVLNVAGVTEANENGILAQAVKITLNDDQTQVPVQYKTLYGNGIYSAMVSDGAAASTVAYTAASITSQSKYGSNQINLSSGSGGGPGGTSGGAVLGVILETDDGGLYGLKQLENIWQNGRELAFNTRVSRFADLEGKTIVKITFIVAGEQNFTMDVNLLVE